jgi:hypothetical protein
MKATELRIGNLVQDRRSEECGMIDIVVLGIIDTMENHSYEPIPLTEEWLIKFGFDDIEMSIPVAYKTKSGFRIKEDQRGYWMQYKYGTVIINHVHQLQNLYFALTGEELTDKNDEKSTNKLT